MPVMPWPDVPITADNFRHPPREYGILPFWFLNGKLDPAELRFQLGELRDKGMAGVVLHGRYGLELPYLGPDYLDRIRLVVEEARRLGLATWLFDEMNWPSGTADKKVLAARPDLAQRYLECVGFTVRGPWFIDLTAADSRYLDFERSRPVAAFAIDASGNVVDLTPNLSFGTMIPWQVPPGTWRIMYIVEKRADYYIDALDPEATAQFLRFGYQPYAQALGPLLQTGIVGFYTDEPAMHYYVTGGDNPIVPWTRDMLRRFHARRDYDLRPRLPDLFFDLGPDSARIRHDFYTTLTEFYSAAFYQQIHAWCSAHGVLFTGHLLYEEWLRRMIRVEGNAFRHYPHMDVVGVDHLYPIVGTRDQPREHVAIKLASSAAHQQRSPRVLCESFGGIFMDATMQRMKWIADWEYVLGVNLLNPHGFHYTLEGPRKRDWPPSMFYQYPWWHYYGAFSDYISRLSHMLSGGRHVAKLAVLWPMNALMAHYTPQASSALADRMVNDFEALSDLLLRLHMDYDYIDDEVLAAADIVDGRIHVADEAYELLVLPPLTHIRLDTVARMEMLVQQGGRLFGTVFLPDQAFAADSLVDVSARIGALFGRDPAATQHSYRTRFEAEAFEQSHAGVGKATFLQTYALARQFPLALQHTVGTPGIPESAGVFAEMDGNDLRYVFAPDKGERQDITAELTAERNALADALETALLRLVAPDLRIDNREVFCLHRVKQERDIFFVVNPTFNAQHLTMTLSTLCQPVLWDPSTGTQRPVAAQRRQRQTQFALDLPPTGSVFVLTEPLGLPFVTATNLVLEHVTPDRIDGYCIDSQGWMDVVAADGTRLHREVQGAPLPLPLLLDGDWRFQALADNALVIDRWLALAETAGRDTQFHAAPQAGTAGWLAVQAGAWAYQLPGGPGQDYPIPVWYRADFVVHGVPARLNLIIDGFAGAEWQLFVNGTRVEEPPVRSSFDSEMLAVDIIAHVHTGRNVLAVRLILTSDTDGLLDMLKLIGDFTVEAMVDGAVRLGRPRAMLAAGPWTDQGYPFYSGRGTYQRAFTLPSGFLGARCILEAAMQDDVLEVTVNGQAAGIRLWPPYEIEVTDLLREGENVIALTVANTPVNLLEGTRRPSGLAGPPRIVAARNFAIRAPS